MATISATERKLDPNPGLSPGTSADAASWHDRVRGLGGFLIVLGLARLIGAVADELAH